MDTVECFQYISHASQIYRNMWTLIGPHDAMEAGWVGADVKVSELKASGWGDC